MWCGRCRGRISVNALEYEEQAKRALGPAAFTRVTGGDRSAFDRLTLLPSANSSPLQRGAGRR